MNLRRSAGVGLLVVVGAVVSLATPAGAHPLGNFSTNVYSGLRVQPDRIEIDHVIDLAEVPTFRSMSDIDADGDGDVSSTEASGHAGEICERQLGALTLRVAGQERPLRLVGADLTLLDGQAGLQTSRTECRIETETLDALGDVHFVDESFAGRVGWREVVVAGDGATITDSDAPESSLSERLSNYPEDRLQSPLAQQAATFSAAPGGDALGDSPTASLPDVPGLDWATDTFTGLVEDRALTVPFAAFAVVVAMVLGSLHAVAPGHGKTVMAAYIVGQHGTVGQALGLGTTVAVTHTAGVLALGVALSTTATFAPEALYPWLGLTSGLLVAAIGGMLLVRAVRNRDTPFLAHQHGDGPGQHRHHHPRLEVALTDLGAADSAATVEGLRDPVSLLVPAGAGSTAVADPPLTQTHHDHDHDHHDHDHDHGHVH